MSNDHQDETTLINTAKRISALEGERKLEIDAIEDHQRHISNAGKKIDRLDNQIKKLEDELLVQARDVQE